MKKGFILVVLMALLLSLSSCNWWAKKVGGTVHINPKNYNVEDVMNVTWKDNNIWVIYRKDGKVIMQEYSNLGIAEGKVIIEDK